MPDPEFVLNLDANPLAVREGLALIAVSGPMVALNADHRAMVEVVLAEVLNNIAEHAYSGSGRGTISVALSRSPNGIECWTVDGGREFPNGTLPTATLPKELHPEGGFGWFMIHALTRGLRYNRHDGENRLYFLIPA